MSIGFFFGCIFLLHTVYSITLSVFNGVGGCLCPLSSYTTIMYTALRVMMYSADRSTSVDDVMTCLIMWEMLRIAPLFCGIVVSLDKNK